MRNRYEVTVGVAIVIGIVVTVVGSLWLEGSSWGREVVRVEALASEVGQLQPGSAVKLRGVTIGRVRGIAVDSTGASVRVQMELRETIPLPLDAAALIAPESLFGDWQVEIVSRSLYPRYAFALPPEGAEEEFLPAYALPDMSRLTAAADEIAGNITSLTSRVEETFSQETAENLSSAIRNIQRVSDNLAVLVEQQGGAVQAVTEEVGNAASEVGRAATAAAETFERVAHVLQGGVLDSILENTREATGTLRVLAGDLTETNRSVRGTLARMDTTLSGVARVVDRVEAGEGSLGRLLADGTVADRTEDALEQLTMLLQDLRENPRRYVRLSLF